jgi:hypothetical protein
MNDVAYLSGSGTNGRSIHDGQFVWSPTLDATTKTGAVELLHATYSWINDANSVAAWGGLTVRRYNEAIVRIPNWTLGTLKFKAQCTLKTNSDMKFSIVVDGALVTSVTGTADAVEHTYEVFGVPAGTLEIWEPFQGRITALNSGVDGQVEGGIVTGVLQPYGATAVTKQTASTAIVMIGDSIIRDVTDSSPEMFLSVIGRTRVAAATLGWLTVNIGYGSYTYCGEGPTAANLATFITDVGNSTGATTVKVVFMGGRNDYAYGGQGVASTPTQVQTYVQGVVNALPAGWQKIVVTPIPQTSEVAINTYTLPNFRTAIAAVTGATQLDGTSFGIVTGTDLNADGIHLKGSGTLKIYNGIKGTLGTP